MNTLVEKPRDLSVRSVFTSAWALTKNNLILLWIIGGVVIAGGALGDSIVQSVARDRSLYVMGHIIVGLLNVIVTLGVVRALLLIIDKKAITMQAVVPQALTIVRYILAQFFYSAVLFSVLIIGVILPGIIFAVSSHPWAIQMQSYVLNESASMDSVQGFIASFATDFIAIFMICVAYAFVVLVAFLYVVLRYHLFTYIIAEKGSGPMEALHQSAVLTRNVKLKLLGVYSVMVALNIVGAMVFLVGLLVTVPLTSIASVYIYRVLQKHSARNDEEVGAESDENTADESQKGGGKSENIEEK